MSSLKQIFSKLAPVKKYEKVEVTFLLRKDTIAEFQNLCANNHLEPDIVLDEILRTLLTDYSQVPWDGNK